MAITDLTFLSQYPWIVPVLIVIILVYLTLKFGMKAFQTIFYIVGIIATLKYLGWLPYGLI